MIPAEGFLKELLMHRGDCSFCTKLLRKDLFTIEQFPVGALNEDFHLLVKMLTREESAVPGIACIPGQAYHVFYRPDSNTRDKNRFSRVFADNIDNADMVLALVDKNIRSCRKSHSGSGSSSGWIICCTSLSPR